MKLVRSPSVGTGSGGAGRSRRGQKVRFATALGTLAAVVDDRRDNWVTVHGHVAVLDFTPEGHKSRRSLLSTDHALREPLHMRIKLLRRYMAGGQPLSVLGFCQLPRSRHDYAVAGG